MTTYGQLFDYVFEKCNFHTGDDGRETWTCDNKLTFTKEFIDKDGSDWNEVKRELEGHGGYCDCEIIFNVVERIPDEKSLPYPKAVAS